MKTSLGELTEDDSNTILYTYPQRLFKHIFFCWSWQEVDAWLILAQLHQRAGKNWSSVAQPQLHHMGGLSASHSLAVSYTPVICTGFLLLLLTQTVQTAACVPPKTTSYSDCLSDTHSCKPSPVLSSHLADCRKCTELQVHVVSHRKLLCCPLTSNSIVFVVTGHPLLWSSAHTEPSILSMLWSPFTVFKLIYSRFTWIKIRPQALI